MTPNRITLSTVVSHIKRCNKRCIRYDWLGFTENKELSPDVEALFSFSTPTGYSGYDWVHGNKNMADLLQRISQ